MSSDKKERVYRLQKVKSHLGANPLSSSSAHTTSNEVGDVKIIDMLEKRVYSADRLALRKKFPYPVYTEDEDITILSDFSEFGQFGDLHTEILRLSRLFSSRSIESKKSGDSSGANFIVPFVFSPRGKAGYVDYLFVIGDPEDMRRVARNHVKKSPLYDGFAIGNGVLSTKDNELWKEQRRHLVDTFLPHKMLSTIFPISRNRAKFAVEERLPTLLKNERTDLNEFFLYEAMAQLQLALLGEDRETMDKTNKPLRDAFKIPLGNDLESLEKRRNCPASIPLPERKISDMMQRNSKVTAARRLIHSYSNAVLERGEKKEHPGPLTKNVMELCPFGKQMPKVKRDTTSTFLFAGHDTTANLMTHFVYAMCMFPEWQKKVHAEVDLLFEKLKREERDLEYGDLKDLQVMKRCINETLRVWPSVPNGTFRELERDEELSVVNQETGEVEKVRVPASAQVMLSPYLLHHNEKLWGKDVDRFDPDRKWTTEEDWGGQGFLGINPESYRYSPFTFSPRDCIGRNFAQMEARVILAHLMNRYTVDLSDKVKNTPFEDISKNYGTLGPLYGLEVICKRR
eukprot:snap_masked-scaffold_24-processed-gene-1.8-mRNA-1 protein AED:0.03 eAED:0.10 QI:0/-1/0/1/-1/1/1/0/569